MQAHRVLTLILTEHFVFQLFPNGGSLSFMSHSRRGMHACTNNYVSQNAESGLGTSGSAVAGRSGRKSKTMSATRMDGSLSDGSSLQNFQTTCDPFMKIFPDRMRNNFAIMTIGRVLDVI